MNQELLVAHVSLAGRKHRDKGLACEDATCSITQNGVTVVCLSDGAGANQYTHAELGSKCVVQTVCELMTGHFDAFYYEPRESVIRSIIIAAVQAELTILADEHSLPGMECMSATMLFCAIKDSRVIFGHIGDGIIVQISGSGIQFVTLPQNGEDASSTYFVTLPYAQDYLRLIRSTVDDAHAYMLMTDGISDMVYEHSKMMIKPVVARLAELAALPSDQKEMQLSKTIRSYIIDVSPLSDDASIGILYRSGSPKPDPEKLPIDKPFCVRDINDDMKKVQLEILPRVMKAKEIVTHGLGKENREEDSQDVNMLDKPVRDIIEVAEEKEQSVKKSRNGFSRKTAVAFFSIGFGVAITIFLLAFIYIQSM
jgi:hypothetical protein